MVSSLGKGTPLLLVDFTSSSFTDLFTSSLPILVAVVFTSSLPILVPVVSLEQLLPRSTDWLPRHREPARDSRLSARLSLKDHSGVAHQKQKQQQDDVVLGIRNQKFKLIP